MWLELRVTRSGLTMHFYALIWGLSIRLEAAGPCSHNSSIYYPVLRIVSFAQNQAQRIRNVCLRSLKKTLFQRAEDYQIHVQSVFCITPIQLKSIYHEFIAGDVLQRALGQFSQSGNSPGTNSHFLGATLCQQ